MDKKQRDPQGKALKKHFTSGYYKFVLCILLEDADVGGRVPKEHVSDVVRELGMLTTGVDSFILAMNKRGLLRDGPGKGDYIVSVSDEELEAMEDSAAQDWERIPDLLKQRAHSVLIGRLISLEEECSDAQVRLCAFHKELEQLQQERANLEEQINMLNIQEVRLNEECKMLRRAQKKFIQIKSILGC